jgi:hypothetical protein
MTTGFNQSDRQISVEAVTGTTLDYNGDFLALFAAPAQDFNGGLLAWINTNLGAAYTDLPSAMAALANANAAPMWDSLGSFSASSGAAGDIALEAGGHILTEAGSNVALESGPTVHSILAEVGGDVLDESGNPILTES